MPDKIHAHQLSPQDANFIRMMPGATFAPTARVELPSGLVTTGAEIQQWIDTLNRPNK